MPPLQAGRLGNRVNLKIAEFNYDGGYQEYMVAPVQALAQMAESFDAAEAAPLMCAGITTFNALRHSGALPSDLVAVQGIGGLGHLGIQFAQKFGYRVAAIGRGPENGCAGEKAGGATCTSIAPRTNAAAELEKLGGARVILATASKLERRCPLWSMDWERTAGLMVVVDATDPIEATPTQLIFGNHGLQGWALGNSYGL